MMETTIEFDFLRKWTALAKETGVVELMLAVSKKDFDEHCLQLSELTRPGGVVYQFSTTNSKDYVAIRYAGIAIHLMAAKSNFHEIAIAP